MLKGSWKGTTLGSGTDAWKYWNERCSGNLDDCSLAADRRWHCPVGGALYDDGDRLDHDFNRRNARPDAQRGGSIPAVHAAHSRLADMPPAGESWRWCSEDLETFAHSHTKAFDNAIVVDMALSGSTNAIIHLIAMAGRAGIELWLDRFDEFRERRRSLPNLRPAGEF